MSTSNVICSILIIAGALFLLISIKLSNKINEIVLPELGRQWRFMKQLMNFFLVGYLLFLAVLFIDIEIPANLLTGIIFFGGALFVYIVVNLSKNTISRVNHSENELKVLNDELTSKNADLGSEIDNCKAKEARIEFLAYYDNLTSLPNRTLFLDRLTQAIAYSDRYDVKLGLLFLDMDNFKRINDTLGHQTGDLLIKAVADRISECIRSSDVCSHQDGPVHEKVGSTVARLGGDEFTVLLTEIERPENAAKVAARILEAVSRPYVLNEYEVFITSSIGIAVYPLDSSNAEDLLKNSDIAMFKAKEHGRNTFEFYKKEMNETSLKRLGMESKLRRALERDEFILHYQPQLDMRSGKVTGMEALLRWEDPDLGVVPPAEFIPLAEETGLIIPIGEWVLHKACTQNKAWQEAGLKPVSMSVNISSQQFKKDNLGRTIVQTLEDTGLDPQHLTIEITESLMMQNLEKTVNRMHDLRERGVRFEVDDFGTGYSSLYYLKQIPLHALKIDRSFVQDLSGSADDRFIVNTIIAMAHSLKLQVIAEAVENEEQLSFLIENGCDGMQGYMLSRPIPALEVRKLIDGKHEEAHEGLLNCRRVLEHPDINHRDLAV